LCNILIVQQNFGIVVNFAIYLTNDPLFLGMTFSITHLSLINAFFTVSWQTSSAFLIFPKNHIRIEFSSLGEFGFGLLGLALLT